MKSFVNEPFMWWNAVAVKNQKLRTFRLLNHLCSPYNHTLQSCLQIFWFLNNFISCPLTQFFLRSLCETSFFFNFWIYILSLFFLCYECMQLILIAPYNWFYFRHVKFYWNHKNHWHICLKYIVKWPQTRQCR